MNPSLLFTFTDTMYDKYPRLISMYIYVCTWCLFLVWGCTCTFTCTRSISMSFHARIPRPLMNRWAMMSPTRTQTYVYPNNVLHRNENIRQRGGLQRFFMSTSSSAGMFHPDTHPQAYTFTDTHPHTYTHNIHTNNIYIYAYVYTYMVHFIACMVVCIQVTMVKKMLLVLMMVNILSSCITQCLMWVEMFGTPL